MFKAEHDAVLQHWCAMGYRYSGDELVVVVGMIEGDRKERFADGRWIMTSMVLSPRDEIAEGEIIRTLNSRYLLGVPLNGDLNQGRANDRPGGR